MTLGPVSVQVLAALDAGGKWSQHALELLGDARLLAQRFAGSAAAWVPLPHHPASRHPEQSEGSLALSEAGRHGAAIVKALVHPRFAGWSSEAVAAACAETLVPTCRVILLPGDARGEEVAAQLAYRLNAPWIPDALSLMVTRAGVLEITAVEPCGKLTRLVRPAPETGVVVITMRAGVAEAKSDPKALPATLIVTTPNLGDVREATTAYEFLPADARTLDLVEAPRIVAAGRGVGAAENMAVIQDLADRLGASVGASRVAVDLGWAPQERQVGQTGRTVRPDLYVACGISGASHHLAGMRQAKHIVAINPDPGAPIHEVAHLSLKGDLNAVIPAVVEKLIARGETP